MNLSDYINLTWVWWTVTLLYAAVILSTALSRAATADGCGAWAPTPADAYA